VSFKQATDSYSEADAQQKFNQVPGMPVRPEISSFASFWLQCLKPASSSELIGALTSQMRRLLTNSGDNWVCAVCDAVPSSRHCTGSGMLMRCVTWSQHDCGLQF
jgi:hypothetical protein